MKLDVDHYFQDSLEEPKMDLRGPTRDPEGSLARPLGRQAPSWMPGGPLGAPSGQYYPPGVETLKKREFRSFADASWRKPTEKKKPSSAGRFRQGDHLPEGEIVAIVIIVVTGIIEIIINIIPNISTISIPSHLTIATCVVIHTIYPLYSVGVEYYFVVNTIEFCWRNIIVSRLFATHLSPLIMISFMSCEKLL